MARAEPERGADRASGASPEGFGRALGVTLVFAGVAFFLTGSHELWRDELHAWTVAKGATSLGDLWGRTAYEGSPSLWHHLLFVLTRVADDPSAMQHVHVLIASAAVFVVVRYAPFPFVLRVLLAFGYFPLYEYGVLARNYGLGMLLAFVCCTLLSAPRTRLGWTTLCLCLLANTSLYGLVLAVGIAALFLWRVARAERGTPWAVGLGVAIAGAVLCALLQIAPPDDGPSVSPAIDSGRLVETAGLVHSAYLPVPPDGDDFWNRNFVSSPGWRAGSSALLLLGAAAILARRPRVLLLCYLPTAAAMSVAATLHVVYARHYGHFFLALVCCLWLAERDGAARAGLVTWRERAWRGRYVYLGAILVAQLVAAGRAGWKEWRLPFSSAEETAEWLRREGRHTGPLAGDYDFAAVAAAQLLGRELYLPRSDEVRTFVAWTAARAEVFREEEMLVRLAAHAATLEQPLTVLLNYRPGTVTPFLERVHLTQRCVVGDGRLAVYRLERHDRLPPLAGGALEGERLQWRGREYAVRPGAFDGRLERHVRYGDLVVFEGYAVDRFQKTPADEIVVVVGGEVVLALEPSLPRTDLPEYGDDEPLAGFRVLLPGAALESGAEFLALSGTGLATVLPPAPGER